MNIFLTVTGLYHESSLHVVSDSFLSSYRHQVCSVDLFGGDNSRYSATKDLWHLCGRSHEESLSYARDAYKKRRIRYTHQFSYRHRPDIARRWFEKAISNSRDGVSSGSWTSRLIKSPQPLDTKYAFPVLHRPLRDVVRVWSFVRWSLIINIQIIKFSAVSCDHSWVLVHPPCKPKRLAMRSNPSPIPRVLQRWKPC